MGLGGFPSVTLAGARERAREAREQIRAGKDPIGEQRAAQSALIAATLKAITFKDAASRYIEAHEAGWRNVKHGQQWRNTLEQYAYPVIGSMLVRDIEQAHVLKVLEPIWREKTETATRLRGRIEKVLDWAKGRGHRSGDNPAAWKGSARRHLVAVAHVPDLQRDKIAAAQLAVDTEVEQGEFAHSSLHLEADA